MKVAPSFFLLLSCCSSALGVGVWTTVNAGERRCGRAGSRPGPATEPPHRFDCNAPTKCDVYRSRNAREYTNIEGVQQDSRLSSYERHGKLLRCSGVGFYNGFLFSDAEESRSRCTSLSARTKKAASVAPVPVKRDVQTKVAPVHELRERVLLVDGTGLAYRCFFALPTLTTYRGTEIGAIVGFMNSLARIYRSFGPKYIGIAFDSPGSNSTKREVWPEYKANRQAIKTSFKKQLMWIKEFCSIVGLPIFLRRSTEADDIIASMISFLNGSAGKDDSDPSSDEEVQQMRQIDFRVPNSAPGGVFDRVAGASATPLEPMDTSSDSGLEKRSFDVHVLTADKDLLQVLQYNGAGNVNVRVVQPHKKFRLVDETTVVEEYGKFPFMRYIS
ncbi:hypothetical protein BOVATA_021850 [Babesia ovata]|uniref:5'-3' exonuclease domain-containing protein n=1 Tax=Babesia ovata TaxID=189622 RepID=A0A2H6KCH7_9APIC|nr:uncharacterized protein BOVATA_021850 [Babesia ovata]GBE60692.1 hypothetical protein BOVATA_021850 [Babesia ovata]